MNKYQKALNKIVKSSCPNCYDENGCASCEIEKICNAPAKYWVDTIQELVDKETPNIIVDKFGVVKCNRCKEPITHPKYGSAKYCLHCGQAIDWSDEE